MRGRHYRIAWKALAILLVWFFSNLLYSALWRFLETKYGLQESFLTDYILRYGLPLLPPLALLWILWRIENRNSSKPRTNSESQAQVGQRAKELGQDIYRFLRERETESPTVEAGPDMMRMAETRRQYLIRTGPIFMDRFGVRIAGIFDELGTLQINAPPYFRNQMQHRIDEVAFFLAESGDRLIRQAQAELNHVAR